MTTALPWLDPEALDDLDRRLAPADAELAARYPGGPGTRQPVHTVYVPADQLTSDLPANWGALALAALEAHAPTAAALAEATALDEWLGNDPATELRVAADEHRRVTRPRLERLVEA